MAAPTTSVLDTFTRANATSLGSAYTADPFFETAVHPEISSNAVVNSTATSYNLVWYTTRRFGPDCEAYLTLTTPPNSGAYRSVYLLVRVNDPSPSLAAGDGYMVEWTNAGAVNFYDYANGTTGAAIAGTTGVTMVAGDVALFEAVGTTLTFYQNGTSVLTTTDATHQGTGFIGFGMFDAATKATVIDDFGGGTIGEGTVQQVRRASH